MGGLEFTRGDGKKKKKKKKKEKSPPRAPPLAPPLGQLRNLPLDG